MRLPGMLLPVLVLGFGALGLAVYKAGTRGEGPLASWVGPQAGSEVQTLLPRIHEVPDFKLVESDGSPFSLARLKGKVWIASFLFTHCASTCPAMALKIQMLQTALPEGVLIVSFSADPVRDTPEVLTKWGEFQNRKKERWLLGTGEWDEISRLAEKGFYLGGKEPLLHSSRFALVDQHGNLRGYYDSQNEAEMTKLISDVSFLLYESQG
ncbi:MAG: SCO family protein [Candidatus Sumerlaeia bacterium]|nr:SCO family protein [Candidatus Sumerlaeia bacterium]